MYDTPRELPGRSQSPPRVCYVGGEYQSTPLGTMMVGQMYVEEYRPDEREDRAKIVLVHGGGQSGTCWLVTPDGRPGWAYDLIDAGYIVYVVDQPGRGRSPWIRDAQGELSYHTVEFAEAKLTAVDRARGWPNADLHTQWPGSGLCGDPAFDSFFASQAPFISEFAEMEALFRSAAKALFDRIGPAAIVTHSQSGPLGWAAADATPGKVWAVVALEPYGPPFASSTGQRKPNFYSASLDWGVACLPLTHSPRVDDPGVLRALWEAGELTSVASGVMLSNLRNVPALIVTGQASYHMEYDRRTGDYLRALGVTVDNCPLAERGIFGNGHMMMLERNSREIALLVAEWLSKHRPSLGVGQVPDIGGEVLGGEGGADGD